MNVVALGVLSLDHHARTNPRFCASCHNMESHVVSYLSSNHLDNIHYQANVDCKDCHTGYSPIIKSVWRYLRGGEKVFSRRVFGQEMCTRCHISMEYQADRTDSLVRNPHLSHWPDLVCGDCHLAHDELVMLVADKVGLAEPQARQAVQTVLGFLKGKLPAPLAGQVEAVLEGNPSEPESLAGGLSGLFGITYNG